MGPVPRNARPPFSDRWLLKVMAMNFPGWSLALRERLRSEERATVRRRVSNLSPTATRSTVVRQSRQTVNGDSTRRQAGIEVPENPPVGSVSNSDQEAW